MSRSNTRTIVAQLKLQDLRDLSEYLDIPLHLKDVKPVLVEYLDVTQPGRHWDTLNDLIDVLVDDGLSYMQEHEHAKMNPKYTVMNMEMTEQERKRKRKEYDARVLAFRKSHPTIIPKTAELRHMVEPQEWEAYVSVDDEDPPNANEMVVQLLQQMQRDVAELKRAKKDDEE
jgi:hypothetical protein